MDTSYSLSDVAEICGGELQAGSEESEITRLSFDSRLVFDPKGVLFFALQSGQNDGHGYISELYQKGVRMFVVRTSFEPAAHMKFASWLKVSDPLDSLQQIAAFHRKKFNTEVLAITGSNGKTIVKEWLAQLFNNDFPLEIGRAHV